MKTILTSLIILLLSACVSTKQDPLSSQPNVNSAQMQLAKTAKLYPKDTVALTQLVALEMQQYEANKNLFFLNQVIASYAELLKRQPYNREALLQFYRLNLFKGLITNNYDIAHWQQFYQQQPFLKNINLSPPEYMALLLAPRDSLSNKERLNILQKTLQANPNFINGYLSLTAMYAEQEKTQLSLFLLETANKYSPNNVEILPVLNELRVDKAFDQLCETDTGAQLNQAFEDYKLLVKQSPENAYYHMQLSTVLRLMGRSRMSAFSAKKAATISTEFEGALAEAQFWTGNSKALTEYFSAKNKANLDVDDLYIDIFFNLVNFNWQQAAIAVEEYIKRDDISFYGVLYGAHAYKMLGEEHKAEQVLSKGLSKITIKPWQQHMLNFANQQISSKQLMLASNNKCNQTEAYFIQGLSELQAGKTNSVQQQMEAIVDLNVYPFYEYAGAKNIIKQLKATAPKS
jgi:hypothetical protein